MKKHHLIFTLFLLLFLVAWTSRDSSFYQEPIPFGDLGGGSDCFYFDEQILDTTGDSYDIYFSLDYAANKVEIQIYSGSWSYQEFWYNCHNGYDASVQVPEGDGVVFRIRVDYNVYPQDEVCGNWTAYPAN